MEKESMYQNQKFQSDIGVEFPDITGYMMQNEIIPDLPNSIRLWFYNLSNDGMALVNIHVWLINVRFSVADLEFGEQFPDMLSYNIREMQCDEELFKLLTIVFENGTLSFLYKEVFYTKNIRPL